MNLGDPVETDKGSGLVVGFPDLEHVEVRLENGTLEMVKLADLVDQRPRSKTGRPLSGIALQKHLAKQNPGNE